MFKAAAAPKLLSHTHPLFRYGHLLEGDRILLCLMDRHGNIEIYVASLSRIDAAIQSRSFAKQLRRDKIGETCLFSLDESKRVLAVHSSARVSHSFWLSPLSSYTNKLSIDAAPYIFIGC